MKTLLLKNEIFEPLDKIIDSLRLNRINIHDAIKFFS